MLLQQGAKRAKGPLTVTADILSNEGWKNHFRYHLQYGRSLTSSFIKAQYEKHIQNASQLCIWWCWAGWDVSVLGFKIS